jgi:hypothetical protein
MAFVVSATSAEEQHLQAGVAEQHYEADERDRSRRGEDVVVVDMAEFVGGHVIEFLPPMSSSRALARIFQ